jgi:hypothetical protein
MTERRDALLRKIKYLEEDAWSADGHAYSEITLRISRLYDSVKEVEREIHNYTFVGPVMPEYIRSQRHEESVEVARKNRVQLAIEKIEKLFGGMK